MELALSSQIAEIDRFCTDELLIPVRELMGRSGGAVASVVRECSDKGSFVVIFAGRGNNGGDGYAAAVELMRDYKVAVYDVFLSGQKTDEGKYYLDLFIKNGGEVIDLSVNDELKRRVAQADVIIDAIFGTGFKGEIPDIVKELSTVISSALNTKKIAVDLPIGINADNGSVSACAIAVDYTVALSFVKPGLVSYPAKAFVGELVYSDLALPQDLIKKKIDMKYTLTDEEWARKTLPSRENNSNKGNFGKALLITGSKKYKGAASLSVSAALRGGCGYVLYYGPEGLSSMLLELYPEVVFHTHKDEEKRDVALICELSAKSKVTLIGSGSDCNDSTKDAVLGLLGTVGGTLILDADAINVLSEMGKDGLRALREAKREVIITPHPLEFSRLTGTDVSEIQLHRIETARKFAAESRCTVVLKGASTVVTNGSEVYINGSGSSALAKAGSGDVLSGFLASLSASVELSPVKSAALAAYIHGKAGDNLALEYSTYGVTPSDLPLEIARCISKISKNG